MRRRVCLCVMMLCVVRAGMCKWKKKVAFQCSVSTVRETALHLCPTSIPLPRLFCPEGNLFPPISISHAIQAGAASLLSAECVPVCHTSCVGKSHGFVTV